MGEDTGYSQRRFVGGCRGTRFTPHVARKRKLSAIDGRTTPHAGSAAIRRLRKRAEETFGWKKIVSRQRKLCYRALEKIACTSRFTAARNLLQMAKLDAV